MSNASMANGLGRIAPTELSMVRRLLHIAVQAVGNLGRSYLPPASDYSHISMIWDAERGALVGERVLSASTALRAALMFDPPSVTLLDDGGHVLNTWPLDGITLSQLESGMRQSLGGYGLNSARFSVRSVNLIDLSVLGKNETFRFAHQHDAVMELAAYYAMSSSTLERLTHTLVVNGNPHVWPHHFDFSQLIPLDKNGGEKSHSITLGMSPGDGDYDQPYFYATPWPYPKSQPLPAVVPPARWHRHEWTGVVLTAMDFLSHNRESELLEIFWRQAFSLLQHLSVNTVDH